MRAPRCWAPRLSAPTVLKTSMLASGTRKAREISGFRRGSWRRASATAISSQSTPVSTATLREPVGVIRVVPRGCDDQAARVLDAVGGHPPQDPVLGDALGGRRRVLDGVAAARMQHPVKAAARPLGQVTAVDEHDVESPQRRIPGDARPGGASADHEHVGGQRDHPLSVPTEEPVSRPSQMSA